MKKINLSLMIIVLLSLISCKKPEEKFIGNWANSQEKSTTLSIIQTDKGLMVEAKGAQMPATYDKTDDKLMINDGSQNLDITFDSKTGDIQLAGHDWIKQ